MNLKGSIVIAFHGRKYLMVKHSQRAWEFPGGHIEGKETPLEAAKREFFEETGLQGRNWKDCGIVKLDNGNLALFSCTTGGRPEPQTDEISESRFFSTLPMGLSFARPEYYLLLERAGWTGKRKTDYDIASRNFDDVRGTSPTYLEGWAKHLARWGHIDKGKKVLDIGCGTGRYSVELSKHIGTDFTGLDFSRGMLSRACQKEKGIWMQGDASHLPFESAAFDAGIMVLMLQHVDDEALALAEAFRVLRPGGRLVIATVSHARIKRHLTRHFPGLVQIDLDRFTPVPEMKWHLMHVGFTNVHHHVVKGKSEYVSVDALLDRFRQRYISTLALVPEGDFEARMSLFEGRLRKEYADMVETNVELTFIEALKPF